MSCIINSPFDGKPSVTHKKLMDYFGDTEEGIIKANTEYARLTSPEFLQRFHGPNEPHWTVMNDSNVTDRSRFTEQFEPMLFEHPTTGELYYKRYDGSRDWVQGKPLAWLSNKAKRQLVDAIIFDSFAGQDGLMETDFEADFELAIEDTLQGYKEMFEGTGMDLSNADLAFLRDEIQKVLKARQLVLKDSVDQNRDSYTEVDEEMGEDDLDELEEGRTSNDVVRKESYFKNSKDTASANIKFMLSFIPNIKSFGVENGELILEYADNELSQELGEPFESYTDPDRLWRKLESNLSDIFSTVDYEGNLISVLDKMKTRMANMAKTDPAIAYVNYYVFGGEGNAGFPEYKRVQFAQAFFKHNIVFSTTDVSGSESNFKYRVIDPTVATSKAGKIRNAWAQTLKQSPFFKVTEDEATGLNRYTIDKETVKKAEEKIQERILELGDRIKKNNVAQNSLTEYFTSLNNIFKYIGIPTEVFTEETWQMLLQDVEAERGTPVNYAQFLRFLMNESLIAVKAIRKTQDRNINKNGQFVSPISSSAIYKRISNVLAVSSDEIGESTVFMPGGKTAWTYSMPSYIDIKLNAYKNSFYELTDTFGNTYTRNKMIDDLQASSPYYRTPVFDMLHNKANANMFRSSIFSGFQKQGNSKYGKDNKNIAYADQLVDKVTKALLPRIEANAVTVHYSPAAADKGRLAQLQGIPLYRVTTENGRLSMDVNEALDIIVRNIEAEYLRSKDAYQVAVSTDKSQLTVHYHLKEMVDPDTKESVFTALNKKNLPVGNAIQIQSAPSLSPYEISGKALDKVDFLNNIPGGEIRKLLYKVDEQNNKVEYLLSTFDTATADGTSVRDLVKQYIANNGLQQRIETAIQEFKQNGIVSDDGTTLKNLKLDERLWKHYYSRYSESEKNLTYEEKQLALYDLVAEYTLNGMIAVDAYNKLFAGDVAYYKDSIDYNKRIPATYTDGKYLIINDKSELSFNTAVIENVKVSATDLEQMKSDFERSIRAQVELMDDETKAKYTDEYISALAEGYADQYNSVNSTDAQGWISLDRWKFLKTKTDGWSPALDAAYERLKNGTFTHEDLKFTAQPLKGVYFERNQVNGVPTYLKYSQAVLIPSVVKGTQLEYLVNAMEKQNVDEVITLDGVKVGALMPTKIHDDSGNLLKDIKFNVIPLSNLHWKLQQQLPVKGMKENMDLGSQPMKNILSNIFDNGMYGNRTGAEIKDLINSTVSDLVMIAFDETVSKLGLDYDGNIVDKPKFYDTLSKLALDKNVPQFAIEALERNYSIDAIPQLRYKIQNIISAQFNNNIAKTITPGGSFIQISNFGVTKQDLDSKTGIYMLKDVSALERPKIRKGEDGKFKVSSGQVFLPHSFIAKYIPDYRELTVEQLKEKISPELFKLIGYRIPNQKLSSNQPLEVVGILPESMGDSIMMYTEITTQTGSDFDIDKTYVMMPTFNVEYSNRKDIVDTLFKMEDTKLLSFREDLEDYREYLNENPLPQDKVNNPGSNKRKLIDYLLDRGLVPSDITKKYVKGLRYVKPSVTSQTTTQQTAEVKKGVEELFESNTELANSVYEVLGFVRSDKVLSENYENYFSEIQDMNSAIFDNLENADLLYTHYEIKELDINSLDLSKKTAGYSDNASDYLKDTLKSVKDQKTPILINGRGEVVEGWHRIHSLKANGVKTIKAYIPITPQQKQQAISKFQEYVNTTGRQDIQGFKEFVNQVETAEIPTPRVPRANKKALQNALFEAYYDILTSPLSYVDMMSGIDGSELKDDINSLHGKKAKLTDFELLDPTYQLRIKFDNIVGKSGVGLTANQMGDHVYGQLAGLRMVASEVSTILGNYAYTDGGEIDLSKMFDKNGKKILDTISMFLNAYVDIAKDPYITKGNFNVHTSNSAFFLIRAGMPLNHIIRFIGQPILKDTIKLYESTLSTLPSTANKRSTLVDSAKKALSTMQNKAKNVRRRKINDSVDAAVKNLSFTPRPTEMLSPTVLERMIRNADEHLGFLDIMENGTEAEIMRMYQENPNEFIRKYQDSINFVSMQSGVLDNFLAIHTAGEQLSEQVLASKADVNGGGHDIAQHFVNNQKYQKVLNSGVFINFDKKFATGSMLGAKTKYTLEFLANMDEKTFITMNPKVKPIYSMIGKLLKGDEYATNKTVVQDIERAMYASFANLALLDTPYEINSNTIKELFKPGQGLVERINSAKIDPKYADNRLIQAFEPYLETEIQFSEEGLVLSKQELVGITLDNFVRKPDAVLEDLNDAWQELLDSPDPEVQKLGRDLIKYAIVTSGLAKNRHSIFEFMPIEVADYLDRGMQKLKDTGMNVVFNRFMEDFLRHNQNENYRKKINFNKLTANNSKTVSTDSVEKLFNLSNLDRRVKFVSKKKLFKTASAEAIRDADIEMYMLRQYKLVQLDNVFYDYYGDIKGTTKADDIMILVPTYVLGKSVGNARIYEYTGNESAFVSNKPNDYQNIKATVDLLKQVTVVEPHTFDFGSVMSYYGKNVEVINYSGEEAKKELISRGIIKENKC